MLFSWPLIRGERSSVSGGGTSLSSSCLGTRCLGPFPGRRGRYVQHAVDVRAKAPVPVALALDELDEALLLEEVQVALNRPRAARETLGQGLHARPAQASLVVRVVCEGAVGGDHFSGDPRHDQVVYLGYSRESGPNRHDQPPRGFATGPPW